MMQKGKGLLAFVYIIFALYFINYPFRFVQMPETFSTVEPWIIFIGGLLLVLGGFSLFRRASTYY